MRIVAVALLIACIKASAGGGESPKVLIIGAGPAGIAAASYLLQHDLFDVTVLEAEPRIGGRINSVRFGDAFVDLGAQWCHGEKDNIVYETVRDLDLLEHPNYTSKTYHSSRGRLDDDFQDELHDIMERVTHEKYDRDPLLTIGDICIEQYNDAIQRKYSKNPEKLKIAEDALEYYHLSVLGYEGSFSWFDPVAQSDYKECDGDLEMTWKGKGYVSFLNVIMKKYPNPRDSLPIDDKILLNKEVERIILQGDPSSKPAVRVLCADGSTYTADHLIFTPSIGVLKERADKLFVPRLSLKKRRAIKNIGFGAVMKVFLHYPDPWWGDDKDLYELIWDKKDIESIVFPGGPRFKGRSWVTFSSSIVKEKYNPNVISIWFTGYLVPAIEELPDQIMKDGIKFILDKFLGNDYIITEPDKIMQSRWYSNPHFRGTYSFQTPNSCSRGKERSCAESDLAEAIRDARGYPVIQFAGEATHPYYYSTVHGAVESGYREARALVDLHR